MIMPRPKSRSLKLRPHKDFCALDRVAQPAVWRAAQPPSITQCFVAAYNYVIWQQTCYSSDYPLFDGGDAARRGGVHAEAYAGRESYPCSLSPKEGSDKSLKCRVFRIPLFGSPFGGR